MWKKLLLAGILCRCPLPACGQAFAPIPTPQVVSPVPAVLGGTSALGGYWGYGLPVVPHAYYPNYYQGYFDPGIGGVPVPLGNIVTIGGLLYLQNIDGTLTLYR